MPYLLFNNIFFFLMYNSCKIFNGTIQKLKMPANFLVCVAVHALLGARYKDAQILNEYSSISNIVIVLSHYFSLFCQPKPRGDFSFVDPHFC